MEPVQGLKSGMVIQDTYRIDALLGEGGMGATFRATNLATGHPVAVKVMSAAFSSNKQAVELFRRESTNLRRVQSDAVIRYETTLMDRDGRLFLVMEFVDGKPLKHYIKRGARLAPVDVLRLGARVADGLTAIHALGIVHRDIAPDNIMIPDDTVTRAKLIDFGLASDTVGTDKSIIGSGFAGKQDFCAPEQFGLFGNNVGPATDRYALGLVLMKVAGLPIPGEGKGLGAVEDRRSDLRIDPAKVSPPLRKVLEKLLKADPAARPEALGPLFAAALAEEEKRPTKPQGVPEQAPATEARSRVPLFAGIGGAAVLALAGAAFFLLHDTAPSPSAAVTSARAALAADDPLHEVENKIAQGGANNLNAALATLIAYQRDEARPVEGRQQAALLIARMYDPNGFDAARSPFRAPNPAAARRYYQQAADLGAPEAAAALARLPAP